MGQGVSLNLNLVVLILERRVNAIVLKLIMGQIHVGTLVQLYLEVV